MILVSVIAPGREDQVWLGGDVVCDGFLRGGAQEWQEAVPKVADVHDKTALPARSRSALVRASAARIASGLRGQPRYRSVGPLGHEAPDRSAGTDLRIVSVGAGDEDPRPTAGRQAESLGQGPHDTFSRERVMSVQRHERWPETPVAEAGRFRAALGAPPEHVLAFGSGWGRQYRADM